MRLFVAVDLDGPARSAIAGAVQSMRTHLGRRDRRLAAAVKWVEERNLHLTLHFLGEVDQTRMALVQHALEPPLGVDEIDLAFGGWGLFPPAAPPRVVWVGLTAGAAALGQVHGLLGRRLEGAGIALERRPFSPHLTVGRLKTPAGPAFRDLLAGAAPVAAQCRVTACTLYRSHLSGAGPTYEALQRTGLRG